VSGLVFEPAWLGMDGVFGGFALGRVVDEADVVEGFAPQAVTAHFVSAVRAGPVDVAVTPVHRGRATASVRMEMRQEGRARVHAVASLVPCGGGGDFLFAGTADTAPWGEPEECPPYVPRYRPLAYDEHLEVRTVGAATLAGGARAWVRLARPRTVPLRPRGVAALLLDVLPPGLFALDDPPFFVPTIDFTVHFAPGMGDIAADWHLVTNRTLWATRDYCVDESTLHDRTGRPLAQIRQGRAIRWPEPTSTP
jgi:acyl-CoA thioesterase